MPALARNWYKEGVNEGIEKGAKEGEVKRAKEVAKNMLMLGMENSNQG